MFGFFSKKKNLIIEKENEYLKKIEELNLIVFNLKNELKTKNKILLEKEKEIDDIRIEREEEEKNIRIMQKQMDILEKNLRSMRDNNNILKQDKNVLQDSALDANLPIEKHKFKISLSTYYSSLKFRSVINYFIEKGYEFVNDLDEEALALIGENSKKMDEFKKRYRDFLKGDIDIPTKVLVLKGEKISKVYSKNRKFITYLSGSSYEYMNDLIEYPMEELTIAGFSTQLIKELVDKQKEYFDKNLIKGREI
ncbi:MAG: hypothetical protein ACRCXY_09420 [Fusobacteriaceae bacterium]